ncbi:MAG: phenylalanine--tRNA ligase subunit beta [Prolixibacteraceae bacterium]|nr:phenylalanine--tRNA ligase subunit beta [Prolixibacteraceae bacterium]
MNISYKWLKDYLNTTLNPHEIASVLTQLGLETGSVEEVESVKGGLKGLVVGEVLTCEKHPGSDHLSITTVNLGNGEISPIVCGAPNVAAGQKVIVATVGTTLYKGDESFTIQKSKIRGEVSAGMICAEDEIGLGTDHNGIMVLDPSAVPGTPASAWFQIESDFSLEVDLTPNRIDSASHIGVARDLAAFLSQTEKISYTKPSVDGFKVSSNTHIIPVTIENPEACARYAGVSIKGITIKESPEWLKNRLRVIGLKPINNVVDITNYVLFETGQPLHAFDLKAIKGNQIIVKTLPSGTKFRTLDEVERTLDEKDLMICNQSEGMCIGGVFGGIDSGITNGTTEMFLESALFNPVYIRKTARRHGLNTDASFRFERGVDPNGTIYALKRAAILICELAGGEIASEIIDVVADPAMLEPFAVSVNYKNITRLIGKEIPVGQIKNILTSLEIKIVSENQEGLELAVPPYRVDVRREADVIEELLRIYGYNNVEPGKSVKSTLQHSSYPDKQKLQNLVSEILTANGFNEIMCNSLTKSTYYEQLSSFKVENCVKLYNPLSSDLNVMRQTLLFGGMETVLRNTNFRNADLKLYEFGNVYHYDGTKTYANPVKNYSEDEHIGIWISGNKENENWVSKALPSSFFTLKSYVEKILSRLGISPDACQIKSFSSELFADGLIYTFNNQQIAQIAILGKNILKQNGIAADLFYGDIHWTLLLNAIKKQKVSYTPLPKFPEVKRDLALLVDQEVSFSAIKMWAFRTERELLKSVTIFDVYEGAHLPEGKKSYAVSFLLRDDSKTLHDKQIEKTMEKLMNIFQRELGAQIR